MTSSSSKQLSTAALSNVPSRRDARSSIFASTRDTIPTILAAIFDGDITHLTSSIAAKKPTT